MADSSPLIIDLRFETAAELEEAYKQHISKGGYFVPSDDPAPRTTPVELHFHLPGLAEPLKVSGEVAFAATPDQPIPGMGVGMAIQFSQMSDQREKAFKAAITIASAEGMDAAVQATPDESGEEREDSDEEGKDPEGGPDKDGDGEEENEESMAKTMASLNMMTGEKLYFLLRKLPLHQKVTAAKRGNRNVRSILIQEGNKKIIGFMLQNPQMSTPEVIQLLKMPNLSQEIIKSISKNSSWSQSEEVKYQIVINPKTPLPLALNILPGLNQHSMAKLAKSGAVKLQIKSNALKLLEQRRAGK